jgi:hypothetical protein
VDTFLPPPWILPLIALPLLVLWAVGLLLSWPRQRPAAGEVVLEGEPDVLSRRLAQRFAASGGGLPALRVITRTEDLVVADRPSVLPTPFERVEVRLTREGTAVRLRWSLSDTRLRRLQLVVALLWGIGWGGLFVIGVPVLVGILVLPSDDPAIRWQVVQTVQMIHGVWPPYMVALLFWIPRAWARRAVEIRIANLPHGS